jgi:hypothetical protein
MTTDHKNFARKVLGLLSDMQDALADAIAAMATEDIIAARAHLKTIHGNAEQAIEALKGS